MIFPANIERWRKTVVAVVYDVLDKNPDWKSLTDRLGITIGRLTDTILAIIQTESSGDPQATGDGGNSVGLMQLNYGAGTPQDVGFRGTEDQLYAPETNIFFGTKYFLTKLDRYDDLDKAILAYNAGSYRTTSAGLPVNQNYLEKVLSFLGEKKTLLSSPPSVSVSGTTVGPDDVRAEIRKHLNA